MAGAKPNAVDDEGESVLHKAVAKKYTECAIVILENGGCKSMSFQNSKDLTYVEMILVRFHSMFHATSWFVLVNMQEPKHHSWIVGFGFSFEVTI